MKPIRDSILNHIRDVSTIQFLNINVSVHLNVDFVVHM